VADWLPKSDTNLYCTYGVALFSVTRRLTQSVVERLGKGGDFFYEPDAELEYAQRSNKVLKTTTFG
jgi:hypothetical protein